MADLSKVSTEELLAKHYGGMDKVPTDVLMRHYQGSKSAPVAQEAPTLMSALRKNLLTNEPVDWSGQMARSAPATIGAGIGATALSPLGPAGMAGGAYIGGVAGEGLRNAAVGLDALYNRTEPPSAAEGIGGMRREGAGQAAGQLLASGLGSEPLVEGVYKPVYTAVKGRVAPIVRGLAGIPEAVTEWAMKRGPKEILTKANAEPIMQQNALEGLREAAIGQKQAAGELVGEAERNYLANPSSRNLFDLSPVGTGVRQEMKAPNFDPTVSDFGGAESERVLLEKLAGKLESGPASGAQLVGLKQNLDRGLNWDGSPIPDASTNLERVYKGANNELRGTLTNADANIGRANPNYNRAKNLHSEYQKPLGDTPKPTADNDKNTIARLKAAFGKGDAKEGLTNFDARIAESRRASLDVRDQMVRPEPAPLPAPPDRSAVMAAKLRELEAAKIAPPEIPAARSRIAPAQEFGPQDPLTGNRNPIPIPEEMAAPLPETPISRLQAAAARVKAEQARMAAPTPPTEKPFFPSKTKEGPGWLDMPETTPGQDFMDAAAAEAFFAKSDPLRSPSNSLLRAIAAAGPATAARLGLKAGQTGVQAARAAAPSAKAALPRILAELLRQEKEKKK